MRKYHLNREVIYPYNEWQIVESKYQPEHNQRNETIFALGNGYIGLRGTFEEGYSGAPKTTTPGTYINGVYESEQIMYGEFVYGMPQFSQTMVNLADWKIIRLKVEDEWFDMLQGKIEDYRRVLDLKEGILHRTLTWESPKGRRIAIEITRCISLTEKHRAAIRFAVTPLNCTGRLSLISEIDGDVRNHHYLREPALQVLEVETDSGLGYLLQETKLTKIAVAFATDHRFFSGEREFSFEESWQKDDKSFAITYTWEAKKGERYWLDKFVSFYTSFDLEKKALRDSVLQEVQEARDKGFCGMLEDQRQYLQDFWHDVDVVIEGDTALQQGIRFNAFQLLQSCGQNGYTSIGAKGLTGEYYEGHYFWDTEVYINPFFLYSRPEIVRQLLLYRYSKLDGARNRAKVLRNKGALYPWRTINGDEASAFFEGSTAQYHINAAIIYALHKYIEVTGDEEFLVKYGAEILFETSRLWADRGGFVKMKGNKFCLNEVCGPDEYKSGVNNNCYTNYMARFNLQYGVQVAQMMAEKYPEEYQKLAERIKLSAEEINYWRRCAEEMYLPFSEELGIHPQDDSFLYKEELDIDALPPEQIPLVRNWHPLNIWRYQICKQADVVLLMFLLGNLFDDEVKKANYDYYEPRTTHDSSLSSCIFSILASEIGYRQHAYEYFMQTSRLDLDDYNGNVHEGIHAACMAGSWMCMINGFAGMRVYDGVMHFKPYLPEGWQSYRFRIKFQGRKLLLDINHEGVYYTLEEGDTLELYHNGHRVELRKGETNLQPIWK